MIGVLMLLVGAMMVISGVTGRWRAVLQALVPGFAHSTQTTAV